jgi:hypothetical protein
MKKPKYIKELEKTVGVFSVMDFHVFRTQISDYFDEKKIEKVFEKSEILMDGSAKWIEMVYKTVQPFYLYVRNESDDLPEWYITIYYKPEQLNELIVFIRQVLKQLRYGTTDDRTS